MILKMVSQIINGVKGGIVATLKGVADISGAIVGTVKKVTVSTFKGIGDIGETTLEAVGGVVKGAIAGFSEIGTKILRSIRGIVSGTIQGAVEAGQMGLSISIANALMSIPMAWMGTKAPRFGTLIAMKDYANLDRLFIITLSRSILVMVMLGAILCAANYFVHLEGIWLASRILAPLPFAMLIIATTLNYVTYAQSTYLRAHKQEPFLLISLVSALLIAILTLALANKYGAIGIMSGYLCVCSIVGFWWGSWIFYSKKREWQLHLLTCESVTTSTDNAS